MSEKITLDVQQIKTYIPHRYPFLLVDRILECEPGVSAIGLKNVTANEEYFNGHFEDNPIMPGVLIVEAMAQTAGICVSVEMGPNNGSSVYFTSLEKVKFKKPTVPGDTLIFTVIKEKSRGALYKFTGVAKCGDEVRVEASFSAMVMKEKI